jgi:hypothetical protein
MSEMNVSHELRSVALGDHRRNTRARRIVDAIARRPSEGFPGAFDTEAELEAFYRFVNNGAIRPDALLAPHSGESWRRAVEQGGVALVLHDTSEFTYRGEVAREGLTQKAGSQGFHGHFAIAVAEGEAPVVHGVVGHRSYVIDSGTWFEAVGDEEEEFVELLVGSERWSDVVADTRKGAPDELPLIHVMDREADDYVLWSRIIDQGDDFVIRAQHNRRLAGEAGKLFAALEDKPFVVSREVRLSRRGKRRPPGSRRTHPPRESRPARLSVRATRLEVLRPASAAPVGLPTMTLSVVEVVEIDPPPDATPIHWLLLSTLPINTPEDICRIVDIYRKRWLIEEFFKSIKTGCGAERRQARSLRSLLNTISLLIPVAWRLLVVRAMSRHGPTAPAEHIVDAVELKALRHLAKGVKLPRRPTCRQVMLAIARVGGHLKSNGDPGWLVLGRGMERLIEFASGWRAAMEVMLNGDNSEM